MASYPTRSRRRANGEGSIYAYRGRYRGALTWTDSEGIRQRCTVYGKTQAEVGASSTRCAPSSTAGLLHRNRQPLPSFWRAGSSRRVNGSDRPAGTARRNR